MASKSRFQYRPEQLKLFFYWINERHSIYLRRKEGRPEPWTKDEILRKYKFTNPFRQLDRVTQDWRARYVTLLGTDIPERVGDRITFRKKPPTDGDIVFYCALFRLFNWPPTYDALYYSGKPWSYANAMGVLEQLRAEKKQIFTGAYIVPNMGLKDPKINIIAGAVDLVHENREAFAAYMRGERSMEKACEVLQLVPTIGPFIAYELVCDLRFTRILGDATDIYSWSNPGPGAKRGIHRLLSGAAKIAGKKPDYLEVMRDLLARAKKGLKPHIFGDPELPFEMREIEHSLCEFDKYMRVKNGEGRPRSLFKPTPPPPWEEDVTRQKRTKFKPMPPPPAHKRARDAIKELYGEEEPLRPSPKKYTRGEKK